MTDFSISFGDNIKSLGNGKFEGYLVRFSSSEDPDLTGDYFTKSTEFFIEDGSVLPILYDHGLNATIKRRKIGRGTVSFDDAGLFLKGELFLRDQFEEVIYNDLVKKGRAGLSSGAANHLMERKSIKDGVSEMVCWGIAEGSVTVAPTEPRNQAMAIKSYMDTREDPFEDGAEDESSKVSVHASTKSVFDRKLADETPSVFGVLKTFYEYCEQIAEAQRSLEITGGELNIKSKVIDAATEAAARLVPLITAQIEQHFENGEGSFYLKTYQADSLESFLTVKGGLVLESPLDEHSAKVVSAVEEFADLSSALAEGIKAWSQRCKDKIEFRTVKSRAIPGSLLKKMAAVHEVMGPILEDIVESHVAIGDLIETATPKSVSDADFLVMQLELAKQQTEVLLLDGI